MSRKKSNKNRQQYSHKQRKSRYPQSQSATAPIPAQPREPQTNLDCVGPEEERSNRLEKKVIALAEMRMDAIHTRLEEDANANISPTEMNFVKLGLKLSRERADREREQARVTQEAEEHASTGPELNPPAAAIGEALLAGDAGAAMQLIHSDGNWPEGLDGLGMMAMAATADEQRRSQALT